VTRILHPEHDQVRAKNLRLFIAVYPPPATARVLLEALAGMDLPPHRLVPPEQVHLTLQFIGDAPPSSLAAIIETVRRAAGGVGGFLMTPQRLITLPQRRPPRLVAVETDRHAALLELQRRLAARLSRSARRRPGDRFRPHLTLCRFDAPTVTPALDAPLDVAPFAVEAIALVQSTLRSDGAQHKTVEVVALAGVARSTER